MTQDVDTDVIEEARKARRRERQRAWRAANPEKNRENARAWYANNLDKERERNRAWRAGARTSDHILYTRRWMLYNARARAKNKDLPFDITIDDIGAPPACPVLGVALSWGNTSQAGNSPSLDRIIPALGYVSGNVMVISRRANTIKNNATPDELRRVADFYAALVTNVNDTKEDSNDTEN